MEKIVLTAGLYTAVPEYLTADFAAARCPWELLPLIGNVITRLMADGLPGYTRLNDHVLIGEGVRIAATATIEGNCIIGPRTEVRPGAYLRGNVLCGADCVLGNSSELKNCLLLDHVQVPHYNYVGDSILGSFSHMGAGSICSNLRSDGKPVVVHGETDYATGLRKVGAFLGDHADVGCGCVLNPGSVVGQYTSIYPLTAVRGVLPGHCIMKAADCIVPRREER